MISFYEYSWNFWNICLITGSNLPNFRKKYVSRSSTCWSHQCICLGCLGIRTFFLHFRFYFLQKKNPGNGTGLSVDFFVNIHGTFRRFLTINKWLTLGFYISGSVFCKKNLGNGTGLSIDFFFVNIHGIFETFVKLQEAISQTFEKKILRIFLQ